MSANIPRTKNASNKPFIFISTFDYYLCFYTIQDFFSYKKVIHFYRVSKIKNNNKPAKICIKTKLAKTKYLSIYRVLSKKKVLLTDSNEKCRKIKTLISFFLMT